MYLCAPLLVAGFNALQGDGAGEIVGSAVFVLVFVFVLNRVGRFAWRPLASRARRHWNESLGAQDSDGTGRR